MCWKRWLIAGPLGTMWRVPRHRTAAYPACLAGDGFKRHYPGRVPHDARRAGQTATAPFGRSIFTLKPSNLQLWSAHDGEPIH